MLKKILMIVLTSSFILCNVTGCGESKPTDELVENSYEDSVGQEEYDIPAGSSYVKNEKDAMEKKEEEASAKTFPTLSELRKNVKEMMGDNYLPENRFSENELKEKTGITEDMYVEFLAERQTMETNIDMMIIIHAKEDYVGAIEQALENYRNRLIAENQENLQNYGKAQASRMETIENYICFVQLGADTSIVADKGEEAIIAYCQEENERVVDVLEKAILQ